MEKLKELFLQLLKNGQLEEWVDNTQKENNCVLRKFSLLLEKEYEYLSREYLDKKREKYLEDISNGVKNLQEIDSRIKKLKKDCIDWQPETKLPII